MVARNDCISTSMWSFSEFPCKSSNQVFKSESIPTATADEGRTFVSGCIEPKVATALCFHHFSASSLLLIPSVGESSVLPQHPLKRVQLLMNLHVKHLAEVEIGHDLKILIAKNTAICSFNEKSSRF